MRSDPLKSADTAYGLLDKNVYEPEVALTAKYQAFMAELLRLALLGIAAFGFLYKEVFAHFDSAKNPAVDILAAKFLASSTMYLFGVTAMCALAFQYLSSETVRMYLEGQRFLVANGKQSANKTLEMRRKVVTFCIATKAAAAITLAVGSLLAAVAFAQLLK
jgi:hypothetical protein